MRRAAIFLVLSPLLAFVVAVSLFGLLLGERVENVVNFAHSQLRFLPFAIILALPAAVLTGVLDWGLIGYRHRWIACAFLGAGVTFFVLRRLGSLFPLDFLLHVPIGAIPAAICSWLSGDRQTGDRQARGA
jgi:hypothetical protein